VLALSIGCPFFSPLFFLTSLGSLPNTPVEKRMAEIPFRPTLFPFFYIFLVLRQFILRPFFTFPLFFVFS